jgi:hypothetical protein
LRSLWGNSREGSSPFIRTSCARGFQESQRAGPWSCVMRTREPVLPGGAGLALGPLQNRSSSLSSPFPGLAEQASSQAPWRPCRRGARTRYPGAQRRRLGHRPRGPCRTGESRPWGACPRLHGPRITQAWRGAANACDIAGPAGRRITNTPASPPSGPPHPHGPGRPPGMGRITLATRPHVRLWNLLSVLVGPIRVWATHDLNRAPSSAYERALTRLKPAPRLVRHPPHH